MLPIGSGDLLGFVTLGPKPSRALFTLEDVAFLATFLNQVAIAIRNAQAYGRIEELNQNLELKVDMRTSELATANARLAESVRQLEGAYEQLKHSQDVLVRSEQMAMLGQLAAGIAHEVNTPLGAALNGLKIGRELADEYAASIGDPTVGEGDHRAIAAELREQLRNISDWAGMAAAFIRTIKNQTHATEGGSDGPVDLQRLIEDVRLLLAHRLRLSSCTMAVECPPGATVFGEAGKLAQVVTNLVANAIDACDDTKRGHGTVRVRVTTLDAVVRMTVEDDGCGIPPAQMSRVFEALYTTKPRGKGTGLGLSICREIVQRRFRGTIAVTSRPGGGSCFAIEIPHVRLDPTAAADTEEAVA